MFVSDRIVFVELHKTGGTHIGHWLGELVGGEQTGKHNRVPPKLRERLVMGAVRNPWDWYVSLWAYGCGGKGSVRAQVTRGISLDYCRNSLPREMGKQRLLVGEWLTQLAADWRKPVDAWRHAYRSADDPAAFREWLGLLLDPARRFDIGEGYGFSPVSGHAGLMTYRYLKLFTTLDARLYTDRRLRTREAILDACEHAALVHHFIRNEHLEDDLLAGLARAGIDLDSVAVERFRQASAERINRSERRDAGYYYDAQSIRLVAEKESVIIGRHAYEPPVLSNRGLP